MNDKQAAARPLAEPIKGPGCDIPACLALGDSRCIRVLHALVAAADFTRSTTEAIRTRLVSEWRRRARLMIGNR